MGFREFADKHYPALAADEARHNVLIAILKRKLADPGRVVRSWDLGKPGACAVQQQGYGIVLGNVSRQDAARLAGIVAGDDIPSVGGADDCARHFVEAARPFGMAFPVLMAQTIHVLDRAPTVPTCDGAVRLATVDNGDLVFEWISAFIREAVPEDSPPTREDVIQRIDRGSVYLWVVDGVPVSMSCIGRVLDKGAAIAPVFTPPEHRCQGFAGAATAAVVEKVFRQGYGYACLYTDDSNPASNRCYAKIGFRPYCKSSFYRR